MRNVLIVQFSVGPTYKERLLNNILKYRSYDFYDVYIITDEVDFFNPICDRDNIFVCDIDEIREDFQWSIDLEKIPREKRDQSIYCKLLLENGISIPTMMERFGLNSDISINYDGFIFMNCDVIPLDNPSGHKKISDFFSNKLFVGEYEELKNKIIFLHGGNNGYTKENHPILYQYAEDINNRYNIKPQNRDWNFISHDGNFRAIKLPNKNLIKPFFDILNNICRDIILDQKYPGFGRHSIWNLHSEYIYALSMNIAENIAFHTNFGIDYSTFKLACFPEDRHWNFGTVFENSLIGKDDFIKKNYEKLKHFYLTHSQEFPY